MSYRIDEIEGIGPSYREKLSEAKISTTEDLLAYCADPTGRKAVAEKTGVSEKLILNWANKADLMRISGVGPQFSELLEAAGVDTVKELRNRNPENLAAKMEEVNAEKKLARTSPSVSHVADWVDAAKGLDPMISH
jgi:predicted flap endonuclease-1-like 5' DNA nuclease